MCAQFVLDSSVTLAWCFKDENDPYSRAVLRSLSLAETVVPVIWPLEIGNTLLIAERRKRHGHADSVRFLSLLKGLPITVEAGMQQRMLQETLELAREHQLYTYDASYLELAMRLGLPLATKDEALRRAAKKAGVAAYEPADVN